jgi:hypothetical protein
MTLDKKGRNHLNLQAERDNNRRSKALTGRQPEIIIRLARQQTEEAIRHLINIMGDLEQPGAVRVRAIELLLERGWGKTPQQIILSDPTLQLGMGAIPLMERIAALKEASQGQTIELEASEISEPLQLAAAKEGEDFI